MSFFKEISIHYLDDLIEHLVAMIFKAAASIFAVFIFWPSDWIIGSSQNYGLNQNRCQNKVFHFMNFRILTNFEPNFMVLRLIFTWFGRFKPDFDGWRADFGLKTVILGIAFSQMVVKFGQMSIFIAWNGCRPCFWPENRCRDELTLVATNELI